MLFKKIDSFVRYKILCLQNFKFFKAGVFEPNNTKCYTNNSLLNIGEEEYQKHLYNSQSSFFKNIILIHDKLLNQNQVRECMSNEIFFKDKASITKEKIQQMEQNILKIKNKLNCLVEESKTVGRSSPRYAELIQQELKLIDEKRIHSLLLTIEKQRERESNSHIVISRQILYDQQRAQGMYVKWITLYGGLICTVFGFVIFIGRSYSSVKNEKQRMQQRIKQNPETESWTDFSKRYGAKAYRFVIPEANKESWTSFVTRKSKDFYRYVVSK